MGKYKPVSECPEELAEIIKFVNLLPKNIDEIYVKFQHLLVSFADEENKLIHSERNAEIFEQKANELLDVPIVAYMYYQVPVWDFPKAYNRLTDLVYAKQIFRAIIKAKQSADSHIEFRKEWLETTPDAILQIDRIRRQEINDGLSPFDFRGKLYLDSNWNIKPKLPSVVATFEKLNIPAERIRECPICNEIFWAKKTDSITCGKKKCVDDYQYLKRKEAKEAKEKK